MSNINERLLAYYLANGAVSKNIVMAEQEALIAAGASRGDWMTYLVEVEGFTPGNVNDMLYKYLGDKGHTAQNINERLIQAVLADDLLGSWSPAEIPNIVDWGIWSDTSRLSQNSDGSGAVSSAGTVVGRWRGQLDVLDFIQPTTANKPTYEADGIKMYNSPSSQKMYASRTTPWNAAFSMGLRQVATTGQRGSFMSTAFSTFMTDRFFALWDMGDPNKTVIIRGTKTTLEANSVTEMNTVLTYDGASSAFGYKSDGSKVTATVGTSTGSSDLYIHLGAASGTVESKVKGWIVVNGQMSDADVAAWQEYIAGV